MQQSFALIVPLKTTRLYHFPPRYQNATEQKNGRTMKRDYSIEVEIFYARAAATRLVTRWKTISGEIARRHSMGFE
jgi:hypothetical protein